MVELTITTGDGLDRSIILLFPNDLLEPIDTPRLGSCKILSRNDLYKTSIVMGLNDTASQFILLKNRFGLRTKWASIDKLFEFTGITYDELIGKVWKEAL